MTRDLSCHEAMRYVYRYLDGELEPSTRADLLRHLEVCRRCTGFVEFERRMLEFIRERARTDSPPRALWERVEKVFQLMGPE